MRRLGMIALVCVACSGGNDTKPKEKATPAPAATCEGLFEPPAGGTKLCDEHVMAENEEIEWTSWAVKASRMDVFRPYQERAGACGAGVVTKPPILAITLGDQRVSVHETDDTTFPSCANKPGPDDQAVVLISTRRAK